MSRLLEASHLTCERGGLSLFHDLGLSVEAGDILHVTGPNGSGKTTLLRVLAGLSSAAAGEVYWKGCTLQACREEFLSSLLYLGHKPAIKGTLTPLENLRWYFPDRSSPDILAALSHWQLSGYENVVCHQLSQGQLQRVALCRLLLSEAALWLLDEPFNAIDSHGVQQLEALLTTHALKGGAVVLVTHHVFGKKGPVRILSLDRNNDIGAIG